MASAGLKRPSEVSPHGSPNSYWSAANKRRCTSFAMQQQPNMMSPSSSSAANTNYHHQQHYHHHQQPNTSSPPSLASSPFKDPASILNSPRDEVISLIKHEIQKAHHHQQQLQQQQQQQQQSPQQYHQHQRLHQSPSTNINQYLHNQQQNQHQHQANSSPDHHDPPVLTMRQTQTICEKLIREREHKLREEYDKILITKLAEQYEQFVKYTQDHIEKRYNETNSHQASYLS